MSKQCTPGLQAHELSALVEHPIFQKRVGEIAVVAADQHAEAAFGVFRNSDGGLAISNTVLPSVEELAALQRIEQSTGVPARLGHLSVERLVRNSTGHRRDICMLLHSHPLLEGDNIVNYGFPSASDLRQFAGRQALNPELIEGVVAGHSQSAIASLMLYRASSYRKFHPRHLLHAGDSWPSKLSAMSRANLNTTQSATTELLVDNASGRIIRGRRALSSLFA